MRRLSFEAVTADDGAEDDVEVDAHCVADRLGVGRQPAGQIPWGVVGAGQIPWGSDEKPAGHRVFPKLRLTHPSLSGQN